MYIYMNAQALCNSLPGSKRGANPSFLASRGTNMLNGSASGGSTPNPLSSSEANGQQDPNVYVHPKCVNPKNPDIPQSLTQLIEI